MPLIILRRNAKLVSKRQLIYIRGQLISILAKVLRLEPREFEVWTETVKPEDWNCPPLAIILCTGPGKRKCRLRNRKKIAEKVSDEITDLFNVSNKLPLEWFGPDKSYFWIRIAEGRFIPIGHPMFAR